MAGAEWLRIDLRKWSKVKQRISLLVPSTSPHRHRNDATMATGSHSVEASAKVGLLEPVLYVTGLNSAITDAELAAVLRECLRMRSVYRSLLLEA